MLRRTIERAVGFTLLVAAAVAARLYFRDIPNFAPVAAVALFAGYLFSSRMFAIAVPVTVLLISDLFIGGYEFFVMLAVYGSLTAPVLFRHFLHRHLQLVVPRSIWCEIAKLGGCVLGASLLFFFITNLAVWATWYQAQPKQFIPCFVQALPFFRYTLLGDLSFAAVLFGGYGLWLNAVPAAGRRLAAELGR